MRNNQFFCAEIYEQHLYFITDIGHHFMRMNLQTLKIEYIDVPKGFGSAIWVGTEYMKRQGDCLYVLEQNGRRLMVFDIHKNCCRFLSIPCQQYTYDNFAYMTIWKNKAYIVPSFKNQIVCIDLSTNMITESVLINSDLKYKFDAENDSPEKLFLPGFQQENILWIFTCREHIVLKIDLECLRKEEITLPPEINGCRCTAYQEQSFLILSLDNKLYQWSGEGDLTEIYFQGNIPADVDIRKMLCVKNSIWLFPDLGNEIFTINLKTLSLNKYHNYPSDYKYTAPEDWGRFFHFIENDSAIYSCMHATNHIICIDKKNGNEFWLKPDWPTENEIIEYVMRNNLFLMQEFEYPLQDFISLIGK